MAAGGLFVVPFRQTSQCPFPNHFLVGPVFVSIPSLRSSVASNSRMMNMMLWKMNHVDNLWLPGFGAGIWCVEYNCSESRADVFAGLDGATVWLFGRTLAHRRHNRSTG